MPNEGAFGEKKKILNVEDAAVHTTAGGYASHQQYHEVLENEVVINSILLQCR